MSKQKNPLDFIDQALAAATTPVDMHELLGLGPTPQQRQNEQGRTHIARGHEPVDTVTAYGVRKVLPSSVTGGAPLIRDELGDWRPGCYREVGEGLDAKRLLFIDGEGV